MWPFNPKFKTMKFTGILFSALLLVVLSACQPTKEEQLMKAWSLDNTRAEVLFKFEESSKFSLQSQNYDGTVSNNTGKWKFSPGKEALLIELNGEEQQFKISELSDKKLTIMPVGEKMKMTFHVKAE